MPTKDEAAQELIDWHISTDPGLIEVYRFISPEEDDPSEPIKLLEVTEDTLATGRIDTFAFGRTRDYPYLTTIATITPSEMSQVLSGEIRLPQGWDMKKSRHHAVASIVSSK